MLFLTVPDLGRIDIYNVVERSDPKDPRKKVSIGTSPLPGKMLANSACTIVAVAHGKDSEGLEKSSVTVIRDVEKGAPTTTSIELNVDWDDHYVLSKGLHMPLTLKSLQYWDTLSPLADSVNFTEIRVKYETAMFLEPESMAWSDPEETELLMNMQLNNGFLRIDLTKDKVVAVAGYGLRDHGVIPIDINGDDKTCNLQTYPNLFSLRSPDTLASLRYDGNPYILTANEGDSKDYNGFEEAYAAKELFSVSPSDLSAV